ncbi:MAG: adenosylcobinamide-GDP ribazoletransferase, partial [Lachnospiraceae bacterium]|nr:adenosylcobinamide-GDP ribazoletransferase [Lachnospiraceae bacterium]
DAFHSYKPKDDKLKILKDPHIGAFSVIMLATYGMVYISSVSEITADVLYSFAGAFFVSRCLSAITVVTLKSAKEDGMLHTFSSSVKGKSDRIVLVVLTMQLILGCTFMIWMNVMAGSLMIVAEILFCVYYRYKTYRELDGITGDTAGWFVTVSEIVMAVVAAVWCIM